MSLAALLLSLPGKVRKLRGNNAPAFPLFLPQTTVRSDLFNIPTVSRYYQNGSCPLATHYLSKSGTNNSVISSHEVANISGTGVVNGIWVHSGSSSEAALLQDWGLEIIIDGVDRTPAGWSHRMSHANRSGYNRAAIAFTPAIGGVHYGLESANSSSSVSIIYVYYRAVGVTASVPVPFNSSLVVNLIHKESNSSSFGAACWVNAWLTE